MDRKNYISVSSRSLQICKVKYMKRPKYIQGETNSKAEDPWSTMENWRRESNVHEGGRKVGKDLKKKAATQE